MSARPGAGLALRQMGRSCAAVVSDLAETHAALPALPGMVTPFPRIGKITPPAGGRDDFQYHAQRFGRLRRCCRKRYSTNEYGDASAPPGSLGSVPCDRQSVQVSDRPSCDQTHNVCINSQCASDVQARFFVNMLFSPGFACDAILRLRNHLQGASDQKVPREPPRRPSEEKSLCAISTPKSLEYFIWWQPVGEATFRVKSMHCNVQHGT